MRLSLAQRVFLIVAAINVAVFAVGGWIAARSLFEEDERVARELYQELALTLRRSIRPEGAVNVARILQWPGWDLVGDALLIDGHTRRDPLGRVQPRGVYLNPVGGVGRGVEFDRQLVLDAVQLAIDENRTVRNVQGGWAVPLEGPEGVWGGCWYRRSAPFELAGLVRSLLLGYLASTLLLTGGTFFMLRRLVLRPVARLADGAQRVREGDLSVRLEESERGDELAELLRSFNLMTSTVQGFNTKLAAEVEHATEQARRAEQAAVTQRRLAAMGELAAGIAHEINNPLGGLQNAVDALAAGKLDPARRERYLQLLRDGLARIQRTVGQLLRFTPRETRTAPVDLARVTLDAAALVRHRALEQGVRIVLRAAGGAPLELVGPGRRAGEAEAALEAAGAALPAVEGSRHDLGQAVLNLIVNALDALEESDVREPRIEIALEAGATELSLRVEDNGPGVPESELGRIADLFYTTKDVGRGTGLGLAIVSNVVSSHGGRVLLENRAEGGLRVELRLPLDGGASAPSASARGADAPAVGPGRGGPA